MNWIKSWLDERRVKALKRKLAKMKSQAKAAQRFEPLMPAVETISRRIRLERIVVLERAVEKIDGGFSNSNGPI